MAAVELDPFFVKALKLLQSKSKDSSSQLKAMLDDVIAQRKGLKPPSQSGDHTEKTFVSKGKIEDDIKRKDAEKRHIEKSSKDLFEPDVKRSKLDVSKQKDKESKDKEKDREKMKRDKEKKEREEAQKHRDKIEKEKKEKEANSKQECEVISDEEEPPQQMDAGDYARDLGLACVVCRQFGVSSGNQLVECQECHSLYHQECHVPPVTGQDVRDPRFVWYCSRCRKSFKKMMAQKPVKSTKPSPTISSASKESVSIAKGNKSDSDSGSQAFRKIDPKAIVTPKDSSNLASSSNAMVGLAGLAANLTKPRGESRNPVTGKKIETKGDSSKSLGKSDYKPSQSKQESGASKQPLSSSKIDGRKAESSKFSSSSSSKDKDDHGKKSSSESKTKTDDSKRPSEGSSSSRKEEKKEKERSDSQIKSHKEDKGSKSSSSGSTGSSSSSSPPSTPVSSHASADSSSSRAISSSSNKQAVANLSMVTANKRIQMMKKKAQAQTKTK